MKNIGLKQIFLNDSVENTEELKNKDKLKKILNDFQIKFSYDQATRYLKKDFLEKKKFPDLNFLKDINEEFGAGGQCLELCVLLKDELKNNGLDSKIIPTNKNFILHQSRFNNHSAVITFLDGKEYLLEVGTSNPSVSEIPKEGEKNTEFYNAVIGRKSNINITNKGNGLLLVEIFGQFGEPFIFELDKNNEINEDFYGESLNKSLLKNQSMFILTQYVRDKIGLHCDGFLLMNDDIYSEKKSKKLKEIVDTVPNGTFEKHEELLLKGVDMYNKYN